MIWSILTTSGFLVFLFLTIYFVIKRDYTNLLVLFFSSIVFSTCNFFYITIWTPDKIVCLGMIICILFMKKEKIGNTHPAIHTIIKASAFILLTGNIVGMITEPSFHYFLSPAKRQILSNLSYIINIALIGFGTLLTENFNEKFFPRYCRIMEIAIITGLIHFAFNIAGIEFMPIHRSGLFENTSSEEVIAEFGGSLVSRIYGFAGEPKGLAFCILPYLAISITMFLRDQFIKSKMYHITFLLLGVFVLFQTYSSSGLINFILLLPLIVILGGVKLRSSIAVPLFFCLLLLVLYALGSGDGFIDSLNERTFERGQTELANDRQESVIMEYYQNGGIMVNLFGWGIGQYTFNVPGQVYNGSILIPVQSGLVLTLCDFGILGIIVLWLLFTKIIAVIRLTARENNVLGLAFSMAALSKFIELTMHGNLLTPAAYLMVAYFISTKCNLQQI